MQGLEAELGDLGTHKSRRTALQTDGENCCSGPPHILATLPESLHMLSAVSAAAGAAPSMAAAAAARMGATTPAARQPTAMSVSADAHAQGTAVAGLGGFLRQGTQKPGAASPAPTALPVAAMLTSHRQRGRGKRAGKAVKAKQAARAQMAAPAPLRAAATPANTPGQQQRLIGQQQRQRCLAMKSSAARELRELCELRELREHGSCWVGRALPSCRRPKL